MGLVPGKQLFVLKIWENWEKNQKTLPGFKPALYFPMQEWHHALDNYAIEICDTS